MKTAGEKRVVIIALITAVCLFGDLMLYIVLPIYWESFGLTSLWQVGILLSVNRLVRLPLNPVIGWLYQRVPKRTGILIAVVLTVITTFSYGFAKGFWLLLLMRCLWGAAWSLLRLGGFLTVLDVSEDRNRGYLIGKYNGLWGLGGLVGMFAGGMLADWIGLEVVTVIFAGSALLTIPFVMKYVPSNISVSENIKQPSLGHAFKKMWKQSNVIPVMLTGLIMSMVFFGIFMSTLSRLIEVNYAESISLFGMMIGSATLAGAVQALRWGWDPFLAPKFGQLSDGKFGRRPFLIGALLVGAVWFALLTFRLPLSLWLIIVICLLFTWTVMITVTDSLAADFASRSSKVAVMTTYTVVTDVGAAIGPSLGYLITDWFGLAALYWFTACLMLGLGFMWLFNVQFPRAIWNIIK